MKQNKKKHKDPIRQPVFAGGKKGLDQFIKDHMRYPEEALKNGIQGTVSVDFDIDVFGDVSNTRVKHGIGYGCDEEAIRLVKLLKFQKRKYQGLHVVFHQNINIHFRNHPAPPPPPGTTVTYQIMPAKKDPGNNDKEGGGNTINIQINF